jgi:hypothetical protein
MRALFRTPNILAIALAALFTSCIPEQPPLQAGLAVPFDGYEWDDSPTYAHPIVPGQPEQWRTLHPADQDWVSFTATEGVVYQVNVTGTIDVRVYLYQADGFTELTSTDGRLNPAGGQLTLAAPYSGLMYVRVIGGSAVAVESYGLSVTILDGIPNPDPPTPQPAGIPSVPLGVRAEPEAGAIWVGWQRPESNGDATITSFLVRTLEDTTKSCIWTSGPLACVVTGLSPGVTYTLTVFAENANGRGPGSAPISATVPGGGVLLSGWNYTRDVYVNTTPSNGGASVAATVTRFPLLVRLTAANSGSLFTQASAGGEDVRFTALSGTILPHEIEYWNASAQQAAIWVLVDTVRGLSTTNIRMHWGRPGIASASNGPAVFETSNGFVGAWHLGNATGANPRPGSVAGSPNAIVRNAAAPVTGIIGLAETLGPMPGFEGQPSSNVNGRYIDLGRNQAFQNNNYAGFSSFNNGFTFSIWLQPTAHIAFARIMNISPDSASSAGLSTVENRMVMLLRQNQTDPPNLSVRWLTGMAGDQGNLFNGPSYTLNQWTQLVVVKPAGNSQATVYKDGQVYGTTAGFAANATNVARNTVWIGRTGANDQYYTGLVDNVTMSNAARSAEFVKLGYETQRAGATAVSFGP